MVNVVLAKIDHKIKFSCHTSIDKVFLKIWILLKSIARWRHQYERLKSSNELSELISKKENLPQIPFFNIFYTDSTKYGSILAYNI